MARFGGDHRPAATAWGRPGAWRDHYVRTPLPAHTVRNAAADATEAVRSTLTVSADGASMTARWDRSDDGLVWEPWMNMTFTRL